MSMNVRAFLNVTSLTLATFVMVGPCGQTSTIKARPSRPFFHFLFILTLLGFSRLKNLDTFCLLPVLHIAVKWQDDLPSGTSLAEFLFFDDLVVVLFSLVVLPVSGTSKKRLLWECGAF